MKENFSAVRWRDNWDVYLLTNMHSSPVEGNFVDECGNAIKLRAVEDYIKHLGYVDNTDRIENSYGRCGNV